MFQSSLELWSAESLTTPCTLGTLPGPLASAFTTIGMLEAEAIDGAIGLEKGYDHGGALL